MSLRVRIALMFAPLVLLLIGLGTAGLVLLVNLGNRAGEILAENYASIEAMHRLSEGLHELDGDNKANARLLAHCRKQVEIERGNITVVGERDLFEELDHLFTAYEANPDRDLS